MISHLKEIEWIATQETVLRERVENWAAINSFTDNLEGLAKMAAALQQAFSGLGGDIQLHCLPSAWVINHKGIPTERKLGQALAIRKRPDAPIQVLLGGHMDTVFPPRSTFQRITEIDKSTLRGPGTVDMKGGLAIMLTALEALERSPHASKIGWEVIITPDEEIGSPGSHDLWVTAARRHDFGLIFEPAFPDGAFVSQRKGSANFTIIVKGHSAHVGRDFAKGRNAINALAEFISKLEKKASSISACTINTGFIEGGGPVNIVPDLAIAKINLRSSEEAIIENGNQLFEEIIEEVSQRDGISIELIQNSQNYPRPCDQGILRLFEYYAECTDLLKIPFAMRETGGSCDGNLLYHAGLPVLDSLGAVGGNMHTHEEYIHLPSLVQRAQLTALFLLRLANGECVLDKELFND